MKQRSFALVWLTFIGGSMGIKLNESPAITLFMDKIKGTTRKILLAVGILAVLAFVDLYFLSIYYLAIIPKYSRSKIKLDANAYDLCVLECTSKLSFYGDSHFKPINQYFPK